MHLHLCPQCEQGNHARCWGTTPCHPPGSYGGSKCRCPCDGNADYDKSLMPLGNLLEAQSAPMTPAPTWYTAEEMRHHLRRQNYADEIADELSAQYAANLQRAFNKGYEIGRRTVAAGVTPIPARSAANVDGTNIPSDTAASPVPGTA